MPTILHACWYAWFFFEDHAELLLQEKCNEYHDQCSPKKANEDQVTRNTKQRPSLHVFGPLVEA